MTTISHLFHMVTVYNTLIGILPPVFSCEEGAESKPALDALCHKARFPNVFVNLLS